MPSNELKLDFMWSLHDKSCDKVHIPQFQQSRKLAIQIGQISSVNFICGRATGPTTRGFVLF